VLVVRSSSVEMYLITSDWLVGEKPDWLVKERADWFILQEGYRLLTESHL